MWTHRETVGVREWAETTAGTTSGTRIKGGIQAFPSGQTGHHSTMEDLPSLESTVQSVPLQSCMEIAHP